MSERDQQIAHEMEELRETLAAIASRGCDHWDTRDGNACECPACKASATLRRTNKRQWRYEGARAYRAKDGRHPRETRIVDAFANGVSDPLMTQILSNGVSDPLMTQILSSEDRLEKPTPRDWYVIMSVVQWLATNCGMCILQEAGWKYTKWDEDRALRGQDDTP